MNLRDKIIIAVGALGVSAWGCHAVRSYKDRQHGAEVKQQRLNQSYQNKVGDLPVGYNVKCDPAGIRLEKSKILGEIALEGKIEERD